ncbi:MAG: hypothetical protein U1E65_13405 [Myxococcota bacterium]
MEATALDAAAQGFTDWLNAALRRSGPLSPEEAKIGAAGFMEAAAGSTYRQAKVALVQTLMHLRQRRPPAVEGMFEALEPWLTAIAAKLPPAERQEALREIQARSFTVEAQIPMPEAVLEQIRQLQSSLAEQAYQLLGGTSESLQKTGPILGSRSQIEALRTQQLEPRLGQPSIAQWGAFLGRLISNALGPKESELLDLLAHRGRTMKDVERALTAANIIKPARALRIAAGLALAEKAERDPKRLDAVEKAALLALSKVKPDPTLAYTPLESTKDGDLEGVLLHLIESSLPSLVKPLLLWHPHIPTTDQLPAVVEQLDAIASAQGRCLEGFNVMTVMHQMGRTVPWLELLSDKLGLDPANYLGVSVPYSGSEVAMARLNLDGYRTLDDHDPRPQLLAKLEDTIGAGNPRPFDELKEEALVRAVEDMLQKHQANHLPILVIDDGGYVLKTIRKHFPEHEQKFRFVEWTTRGVRQFESVPDPKVSMVSAAEADPKTYFEPPFIAKAAVEHLLASAGSRFESLQDLEVATIGHGSIGRAASLGLAEAGARVTVGDLDPGHLALANKDGFAATQDVGKAVAAKKLIVGATGANSAPPPIFDQSAPGSVWASLSSVDIETRDSRDNRNNGTWGVDLSRATVIASMDPDAPGGAKISLETRQILNGGYPLNLSRRVRVMPLEEEEVILLTLNEAIAQATQTSGTGKEKMSAAREDRIRTLYEKHHPDRVRYVEAFWAKE